MGVGVSVVFSPQRRYGRRELLDDLCVALRLLRHCG